MIASLIVAQILLPLILIAWLAIAPPRNLLGVLLQAFVTAIALILRCGDIDVLLAHFRTKSLSVQTGMAVQVGDHLAEVGNSGASDEPHLHIHAQRPGSSVEPFSGDPVPMQLAGRFLIRGDRVTMPIP